MKKEKQVRSYKRRTKSGKTVTVKAHTAKYEAADEKAKEVSKKPGAGKELEERKKKAPVQLETPFDKEEEKKVLEEVKDTFEKETKKKTAKKLSTKPTKVYKHIYGPNGNGDPKKSAENNAAASIRESSAARDALSSSDAHTFEQFKRTKAYKDLSPAAKEWAHYYKDGGWLKNNSKKVRPVGSGTNGPTPKKKTEKKRPVGLGTNGPEPKSNNDPVKRGNKVTVKGKTYYVHEDKIYDKNGERVRFSKKDGALGDSIRMKSARMDANAQNANDSERSQRATKRKEEQKAALRKSAPMEKATKRKAANEAAKSKPSEPAFTAAEFKEWYRGTGSATDKKVAKALRAQLGRSGYRKFEDEAIDNYTSRGHLSMFKRVSGGSSTSAKPKSSLGTKKETSSDLRARADKMDADTKRAAIVKKLGSNKFRTIKDININVVKPNTRSAQLKGTLYVSSDRTKAYYEGSDGKLKKATKSILDRYVNKESQETFSRMSDAFIARYYVKSEKPKHKVQRSRRHIDNSQEQALYEGALKSRRRRK